MNQSYVSFIQRTNHNMTVSWQFRAWTNKLYVPLTPGVWTKRPATFSKTMPRKLGPERSHFDGPIQETQSNGSSRYFWRCNYCKYEIGGQTFQNRKARIHLSGDLKLRNGIVANVCERAPEEIKEQFGALVAAKRHVYMPWLHVWVIFISLFELIIFTRSYV